MVTNEKTSRPSKSTTKPGIIQPLGQAEDPEVRAVTTKVIELLKGDGIPLKQDLIIKMRNERLNLEKKHWQLGLLLRNRQKVSFQEKGALGHLSKE